MKLFIILGAINGFIAVALGAFGAHGLEGKIPDKYLETWQTAVQYQMFHAVGLLVIGLLAGKISSPLVNWSGWLMLIGIILFSGSLFVLSVTQIKVLGAITPLGGVSFLAAWVLMVIAAYKYL
ncbi:MULTISPECIES: DUF423 domain-containing protein [Bacillaceae]|uniref:DUF423 domain-containing protein n=1 Tax=Peribacillus simplex TaxID=1478 RepID=A0A120GQ93_9BACI|nr:MULTISPECIES: DUF423 domain-containing protein [Bacillaceae]KWW20969.1 hypothetical protein AS888_15195 [Peribacillus simplex]PJN91063.1 DUF423 domain-containing protein [Bacillus sp. mrc49]PJN91212.1 DUF423 domain-containing protein [Bacillus sp. mrc49]PJN91347.1 DUF423 domain-containing protein [Bacillus sp. mrc49]